MKNHPGFDQDLRRTDGGYPMRYIICFIAAALLFINGSHAGFAKDGNNAGLFNDDRRPPGYIELSKIKILDLSTGSYLTQGNVTDGNGT